MMRHGLRALVGMEQSDHQRAYNMSTGYKMNEERRLQKTTASSTDEFKERNKKASKHSHDKSQVVHLSEQIHDRSRAFVGALSTAVDLDIPSISDINKAGRRVQDKENLRIQIERVDAAASRLTRQPLDINAIENLAKSTRLTNDATFVGDPVLLKWRGAVQEMIKQKYWATVNKELANATANNAKFAYRKTYCRALRCLIHMRSQVKLDHIDNVFGWSSYNQAKVPINSYIGAAKELSKKIFGYVEDVGGFDDKRVCEHDVLFLFVRLDECAVEQEEIEQVEEAVANSCTIFNPHYTYTARVDSYSDEEDSDSDSMMEPTELDFDED